MHVSDFCYHILTHAEIEDKLLSTSKIDWAAPRTKTYDLSLVDIPARHPNISFSDTQIKFPKKGSFHDKKYRAIALHFFANHELMAIELFAWAILRFPEITTEEQKKMILTLSDEQKHFKLYQKRIRDFGVEFGDYPVNDFFWRVISQSKSVEQFYSLMGLTFEQANLDFMAFYADCFREVEDFESASILNIIYEDEISHVKRGARFLDPKSEGLWNKYIKLLPAVITPARGKGIFFDKEARKRAGLDQNFIDEMLSYIDDFKVTQRKEWK